jgi:hypothetical protein
VPGIKLYHAQSGILLNGYTVADCVPLHHVFNQPFIWGHLWCFLVRFFFVILVCLVLCFILFFSPIINNIDVKKNFVSRPISLGYIPESKFAGQCIYEGRELRILMHAQITLQNHRYPGGAKSVCSSGPAPLLTLSLFFV